MTRKKARDASNGRTAVSTTERGRMESSMERANISIRRGRCARASGRTDSACNGSRSDLYLKYNMLETGGSPLRNMRLTIDPLYPALPYLTQA